MTEVLYRYDMVRWSLGVDQWDNSIPGHSLTVRCSEYHIIRRTPQGAWIEANGGEKFVRLTARKQFACETRELAAESFRRRKQRHLGILKAQIEDVEKALKLIDKETL